MFGPDKCGEDYKLHFIFRHQNPLNKDWEEKHAKRPDMDLKKFYTDKKTHLYTLGTFNSYKTVSGLPCVACSSSVCVSKTRILVVSPESGQQL